MFSRLSIQTRLSTVDAERILDRLVQPSRDTSMVDATRPFVGWVEDGRFNFHRIITHRNSFLPIINGRIEEGEGGAVLRVTIRTAASIYGFMTLWMGMTLTAAVLKLPADLAQHRIAEAIWIAFFPIFGAVLCAVGYYPEARKARRMLLQALDSKDTR